MTGYINGKCMLCPRGCGVNRDNGETGYCGMPGDMYVAKTMLHMWEEPVISGKKGAGAIFFSGCSLRCVYCQNRDISHGICGDRISVEELCDMIMSLEESGAECIDLVTPTHYADKIARALEKVKKGLKIPVVYNCGGYESIATLKMLDGLIDIYMPDFKYFSSETAMDYSAAPDYYEVACRAVAYMYSQVGKAVIDNGLMKKGLLVRHLVLPGGRRDSENLLKGLAETVPPDGILLSLMSQYTPDFAFDCRYRVLHRRVTSFEYNYVLDIADKLGFDGFMQERTSSDSKYTPNFR